MSDFLQRLIERTLKPAATIRPLLEGGGQPLATMAKPVSTEPLLPNTACGEPPRLEGRAARGPNRLGESSQTRASPSGAESALPAQLKQPAQVTKGKAARPDPEARRDELVRPSAPPSP